MIKTELDLETGSPGLNLVVDVGLSSLLDSFFLQRINEIDLDNIVSSEENPESGRLKEKMAMMAQVGPLRGLRPDGRPICGLKRTH